MSSWDVFALGLAEELPALPVGALVVIGEPGESGRYVQFHVDGPLYAELMSDRNPTVSEPHTPEQCRLIAELGWREPGTSPEGTSNWWIQLEHPILTADYRRLAMMAVAGLRDGLGVSSPADLVYRAWDSENGNSPLEMPALGIVWTPEHELAHSDGRPSDSGESVQLSASHCEVGPPSLRESVYSVGAPSEAGFNDSAPEEFWTIPELPDLDVAPVYDLPASVRYSIPSPYNPPALPADPAEMTSPEVVEFVGWIRNLVWSWNTDDLETVLVAAGLRQLADMNPDCIAFTSCYSIGRSYLDLYGDTVAYLDTPVAHLPDFGYDDIRLRDVTTRMTSALTAEYGEPDVLPAPAGLEKYGPHMVWVGTENTVTLSRDPLSVRAMFQLNEGIRVVCGEAEHARWEGVSMPNPDHCPSSGG